jgi:hypothetical protein
MTVAISALADQWIGILNIFPDFLSEQIIPALDITNQRLRSNFANLKFSPGGKRTIQEELAAYAGPEGQLRFLDAFIAPIGAGLGAALAHAQIPINAAALQYGAAGFGTLQPALGHPQGMDYLIEQITKVVGITSGLATIGAGKFLSPDDLQRLADIFNQLFATSDPKAFSDMAAKLEDQLKPVIDFLNQAMQQSAELFGRGLQAALQAATEADAKLAFFKSINEGIYNAVVSGLIESLIATAGLNDLLAPLQKAIRESVQESVATGIFHGAAFQAAVLPAIEAISTRADLLGPMVEVLHEVMDGIKEMLGLKPEVAAAPAGPQVVYATINVSGAGDPESTARAISKVLRGTLPPPA